MGGLLPTAYCRLPPLIGRGQDFWLQKGHWYGAALNRTLARLDTKHLCATNLALKSLTELIRHSLSSFLLYYFCCIGFPQQDSCPFSLPLVTIISLLQTVH